MSEDSLLTGDRARRQSLIKEVRTRRRQRERRKTVKEILPRLFFYAVAVFLLAGLYFGTEALNDLLDEMIFEEVPVFEKVEEKQNDEVLATITAYTSSIDETDDTPFITASGAHTGHGIIACPPKYDFGTQVKIEGRTFTCEDRMNRRYHHEERFDMWVETKTEAFNWGVRQLPVAIVSI